MNYTGAHLFKMVFAFTLIEMGLPAQTVTLMVEHHWNTIAESLALSSLPGRYSVEFEKEDMIFLNLTIRSIHEIQFDNDWWWDDYKISNIFICDGKWLQWKLGQKIGTKPMGRARVLLCVSEIFKRALDIASDHAGVSTSMYDHELNSWLPEDDSPSSIHMMGIYPDRSNLKVRRRIHSSYKTDPDSLTEDGKIEAAKFASEVLHRRTEKEAVDVDPQA